MHEDSLAPDMSLLMSFCIFNTQLAVSAGLSLIAILAILIKFKVDLLLDERRPINRSESVLKVSSNMRIMFSAGLIINVWIHVYLYEGIDIYMASVLSGLPGTIGTQNVFLFKVLILAVALIVLLILGKIGVAIYYGLSDNTLLSNSRLI